MPAPRTAWYRRHCRLPAAFAAYRARSAWRSSSSTSALSRVVATPTVAVETTEPSARAKGSPNAWTMRSANASTVSASAAFSMSSANSSPPSRATVSESRTTAESRVPAATSSSSPTLWPIVSFTTLKSSRSTKSTPAVVRPVLEQQAVGQAGQRVVEGPVLQLSLELALRGHVPQGEHQAADRAIEAQVAAPDLDLNEDIVT